MVREAPHIQFQFIVDIWTIPNILFLLGNHLSECLPGTFIQYQLLCSLQHTPAHTLAIVIINTLLLEEAYDILIHPLLISFCLLVQIMHHTCLLLTIEKSSLG